MRRALAIGLWAVALVACLVVAVAALVAWWWWGTIPARAGTVGLAGLSTPVTVVWDPRGVPTIEAASLEDALRAQGYLHGLFRPLQVELRRRAALGELAAFAGPALLEADEFAIRSGYRAAAEREAARLSPGTRRLLDAYVGGLNAGLEGATRRRPPELRVARLDPGRWTARDVLAFGRVFASQLSPSASAERERLDLIQVFGAGDAAALWTAAHREPFPPVPPGTRALLAATAAARSAAPPPAIPEGPASNGWAVSPRRSVSGGALVANDPHLGFELPAPWYEVRLQWPGGFLAGVSLAGIPGVLIGQNRNVAWAITAAQVDDADLFLTEVDQGNRPARYRENGAWREFRVLRHEIAVAGQDRPVVYENRTAGPAVLQDVLPGGSLAVLERSVMRERDGQFDAFLAIDLARSTAEAIAAARRLPAPMLNVIIADRAGSIAHAIAGAYPVRSGVNWDGRVPAPWTGQEAWAGYVAPERMPLAVDPVEGFVASANDAAIATAPPGPGQQRLTGEFEPPLRAARIRERLASLPAASAADMAALQMDARSNGASAYQDLARDCGVAGPLAVLYLRWDGQMRGAGAPLLHELFRAAVVQRLRDNTRLGTKGNGLLVNGVTVLNLLDAAHNDPWIAEWLDDPATAWPDSPCEQVRRAFDEAVQSARNRRGADPATWTWETVHVLALHSPVARGPLVRWFDPPPVGLAGAHDAVLAESANLPRLPWNGMPLRVRHGPSYRIVSAFDRAGDIVSSSALPGGEDEHPGSPHAFDRLGGYAAGLQTALVPAQPADQETLRLVPR